MRWRAFAIAGLLAAGALGAVPHTREQPQPGPVMTVYKDPNCGCCKSWIDHLRTHGFRVIARDTSDMTGAKRTGRVPERLQTCHTGFVGGYVVEGHVPAADIKRMLDEKPRIAGLAVPGMPIGSPGLEVGNPKDPYEVIAFNRDGTTRVFARH